MAKPRLMKCGCRSHRTAALLAKCRLLPQAVVASLGIPRDPQTLLGKWRIPGISVTVKVLHAAPDKLLVTYVGQGRRAYLETDKFIQAVQQPGTVYLGRS